MKRGAIFDLDGTLLRWPSSETRFLRHAILDGHPWARAAGRWATRVGTSGFRDNKAYYAGMPEAEARALAEACFSANVRRALHEEICDLVAAHRAQGDVTGILTGAPQFLVEPIGRHLDVDFAIGTSLTAIGGVLTGNLDLARPYGRDKVTRARAIAEALGFRLDEATAYGNEMADRFLLAASGRPVAVNPCGKLWRLAREKGWRIVTAY